MSMSSTSDAVLDAGALAQSSPPRRAKDAFADCALVEIIHLHDCFRGALKNLEADVSELCREIVADGGEEKKDAESPREDADAKNAVDGRIIDLERRVAGRFTVIWSVFRAHSAAEDEFIWPALKAKQVLLPEHAAAAPPPPLPPCHSHSASPIALARQHPSANDLMGGGEEVAVVAVGGGRERAESVTVHTIEQEEYEEDHADEERMFNSINARLSDLREELAKSSRRGEVVGRGGPSPSLRRVAQRLLEGTRELMVHLMTHLEKEETHCMPLVAQHLSTAEINDLVGKIMGKRSSELMSQILTMAVENLDEADRDDMVRYMKQAMVGTFFERWLKIGGWITSPSSLEKMGDPPQGVSDDGGGKMGPIEDQDKKVAASSSETEKKEVGEPPKETTDPPNPSSTKPHVASAAAVATAVTGNLPSEEKDPLREKYTSAAELEKLIRAIGTNPHLDSNQKNLTIQGLRDSVWKSNCRLKRKREDGGAAMMGQHMPAAQVARLSSNSASASAAAQGSEASRQDAVFGGLPSTSHHMCFSVSSGVATRFKRDAPPSSYWKKTSDGEVKLVWSSDPKSAQFHPNDGSVPLFSASELAPTYHDGGINQVLGCPHYARSCKLRHPVSERLYTCRLCCEQTREMDTTNYKDSPLDRYEVKEVLCMRCNALQPAGDECVNPECSRTEERPQAEKKHARYTCKICNFYDDSSTKSIYHCPFCNVCRSGQGLGIDYRHCMRCNACVSIKDDHHCIPQRLQGNCPICHETMFESTEPLRGLQCGHVMHLSCFSQYMRGHSYTCPLCKKSAEDMREYFALLDSAVRMQPMPPAYAATTSNIYCQDCCKMGNVKYHFVGLKCDDCGSYNTRELQRVDPNIMASLFPGR